MIERMSRTPRNSNARGSLRLSFHGKRSLVSGFERLERGSFVHLPFKGWSGSVKLEGSEREERTFLKRASQIPL